MSEDLAEGWALIEAGDVVGLIRHLRFTAERLAISDVARLLERAAAASGFDDLRQAAADVAADPSRPQALFDFGYACIERGVPFLAVPALREALTLTSGAPGVLRQLVTALEDEARHGEAVAVLDQYSAALKPWPDRYLLAFNALLSGDAGRAAAEFVALPDPEDDSWSWARERLRRMLDRARSARTAGPLDGTDLRGWHFVLTGGMLAELSPFGFEEGMTGRYAYTSVSFGSCLRGLLRLRTALEVTGHRPRSVSLLPDRSSHILGLAAAQVLNLPAEPFAPERPDTVVVAFDLNDTDEEIPGGLRERASGQVLYEHATSWTDPPAVSADVSGLLHQRAVEPWGSRLRQTTGGSVENTEPDGRPAAEVAADIVSADPSPDSGDGATPADPDEAFARFVQAVGGQWLSGPRLRVASPGPVRSSRFA